MDHVLDKKRGVARGKSTALATSVKDRQGATDGRRTAQAGGGPGRPEPGLASASALFTPRC